MKHYTSAELIDRMDKIGYWYDDDSSYKGYIVFRGTDDGWTAFPMAFDKWSDVAEWYASYIENL